MRLVGTRGSFSKTGKKSLKEETELFTQGHREGKDILPKWVSGEMAMRLWICGQAGG
jgi:hypothetical protein